MPAAKIRQSTLSFNSSKTPTASKKGKSSRVPSFKKSESEVEEFSSFVDDESEIEETTKAKTVTGQKRKRDGVVKTEVSDATPVRHPELKTGDPRWRKLSISARKVNGNLQLSDPVSLYVYVYGSHSVPVHAENQNKVHDILRVFDLTSEYGPCYGVSRMDRWERAEALGLHPPPEIRDILMTRQGSEDSAYAQCVFFDQAERI
ncbi:hypothetical protein D9757_009233 [Collybiopsis confluens]|uniref:DNA polymerase delta subunit 4 n=1 Tax=Collybiopsis confluens TaxID=2823264 RepID=A0A8H5HAF0_9AGAR|nr:hypothetical protein D9757_009233 [Collybiopsis confluens]